MADNETKQGPQFAATRADGRTRFALSGDWTLVAARRLEQRADELVAAGRGDALVVFDLSGLGGLDTAGAWLVNRARHRLAQGGVAVVVEKATQEHDVLLEEAHWRAFDAPARPATNPLVDVFVSVGRHVAAVGDEIYAGLGFLGEFVSALSRMARRPGLFRGTSLVFHLESIGLRSVPIIALINLLVGAIVAQQGIFQLLRFGATSFTVDLIGILVLRELGVLLTSIMIAGRSGSAITAELGSMKMREEVDALRVMGLSPIEVLVAPRLLALIIALPMLTFVADMSALFGGLLVSWSYGGISPAAFLSLLKLAIKTNTFLVGVIKAPFMALIIGLIAAMDGLSTAGSAESLGRQVTASVVKSIFMVIVVDGLFAIFFAAIDY